MTMGNGTGGAPRRVVVTGMGLISPVGNDLESSWQNMLDGKSGGGPVTQWETTEEWACRVACEVKGFDPLDHMDRRDAKRQDRVSNSELLRPVRP